MKNVSENNLEKNQNTSFVFNIFFSANRAVYQIKGENTIEQDRTQMTTWYMRIACCIPNATNTHPQYVILTAFPL